MCLKGTSVANSLCPAMPLTSVTIQGYRSVQGLRLPLDACSVFVGANGVGKANLYSRCAVARGGRRHDYPSNCGRGRNPPAMWARDRPRCKPVRLILKAHFDELADRADALPYIC
jgi:hypothetical protein